MDLTNAMLMELVTLTLKSAMLFHRQDNRVFKVDVLPTIIATLVKYVVSTYPLVQLVPPHLSANRLNTASMVHAKTLFGRSATRKGSFSRSFYRSRLRGSAKR